MKAIVNIKLGKVDGVPTARAIVSQRKMTTSLKSGLPLPYYKKILTIDFPVNIDELKHFNELSARERGRVTNDFLESGDVDTPQEYYNLQKGRYQFKRWRSNNGKFGKVRFHLLTLVKEKLEEQTKCRMCDKGNIWFTRGFKDSYIANWYKPQGLNGEQLCDRCNKWLRPTRGEFNPTPELDDDKMPFDNIFSDAVTELKNSTRQDLLEDINYMSAVDVQESKKFLGTGTDDCIDDARQHALAFGANVEEAEEVYASCNHGM